MLKRLLIRNYAIIDEIDIDFSPRLNIITGETGAGKSIILGALGLIKGERAQSQMVRDASKKCSIEGHFDISQLNLESWFEENNVPFPAHLIIRRDLTVDGKSKAFINDNSVNLGLLQDLGLRLVEIHSQHDSLELKSTDFQLEVVDAFADNDKLLEEMGESFQSYYQLKKNLEIIKSSASKSQAEKDLQTYQLQELNQYDFSEWNQEEIEKEHDLAENALEIKQMLGASVSTLKDEEVNLMDSLREILNRMRKFEEFSKDLEGINEQLDVSIDQLDQVARDYERLADKIDFDEERLVELREQMDFMHKMRTKHQLQTLTDLVDLKQYLETALSYSENLTEKITETEQKLKDKEEESIYIAKKLSERRKNILADIENRLLEYLRNLKMDSSQFQIELNTDASSLSESGYDKVEFLFTANAGSPLRELKRAISGGEMSRFMLAIKSLIAQKIHLPTMIFDEIDTGVSGLVANKVADALDDLTKNHQIVAITHLPQIASRGSHHMNVFKKTENDITSTDIKVLHQADREIEIARMISGEEITQSSLTSARELLG